MTNDITTIGCDIGDKTTEICVQAGDGSRQFFKVRTTKKALGEFFARTVSRVVIEVGTHSRWISELLAEKGHQVTVANPRRLKMISQSDSKSDRNDCELLTGEVYEPIGYSSRPPMREALSAAA